MQIQDIFKEEFEGKEVELQGWVYRERASKTIAFIVLRDSSNIIQCVFKKEVNPGLYETALEATIESAVQIKGILRKDERSPSGYEIDGTGLDIVHKAERFPITKDQSTEFLMDMRHLWIRSQQITKVMKIKNTMLGAAREYFQKIGAFEVTPPIITPNACEGGTTLFPLKYFNENVYLSQSAQMYLEAIIFSLESVYALTPSFRAEKSRTTRHLAEYWHLEWEGAWTDYVKNMDVQEELIRHMVQKVLEKHAKELEELGRDPKELEEIGKPFKRMTYDEAIEYLQKKGVRIKWGDDLGTEEERILTAEEKAPIFVHKYPGEAKAFYMKQDPANPKIVLNNDLLAPEGYGEIIGGSERETEVDILVKKLKEEGIDLKDYEWYLDLRRFGSIPHSGFGIGIERVVRWICKLEHIRDTIPFPRTMNRFYP